MDGTTWTASSERRDAVSHHPHARIGTWRAFRPSVTSPPDLTVILLDRLSCGRADVASPPTSPVAAAFANAFNDATGKRIRTMPMTLAHVRAALKA